jgi:NAD(P)-dependent dehydrogenase (short-subunit alcohol dehydrogenase family)
VARLVNEGMRVCVVDLTDDVGREVADAAGGTFFVADAGDAAQVDAAFAHCVETLGGPDLAFLNATGITLSQNQYDYVNARIAELGLTGRVRVQLLDYTDLPANAAYDKIASVGMFEHVGKRNLPSYFQRIQQLLAPGGLVLNHGITTNSLRDAELGGGIGEFVDEYVFPGGELMHVTTVVEEMSRQGLEVWDAECLRPHYAKTLWSWVDRLEARRDRDEIDCRAWSKRNNHGDRARRPSLRGSDSRRECCG